MNNVVLTNGCFDVLHVGHFNLLTYCRKLAGPLGEVIILLDSDIKIQKDKGFQRPIFNFDERKNSVLKLDGLVDKVFKFDTNEELYELIKSIKPDILVKGSDWKNNIIGSDLAEVKVFNRFTEFSTSDIIKRIMDNYKEW